MKKWFEKRFWGTQKSVPFFVLTFPLFALLYLCSLVYGVVVATRRTLYLFLLPRARFSLPLISVGNITCGGTGKTPLVSYLLTKLGPSGGVVSRGYKGRNERKKDPLLVSDNGKVFASVTDAGDEAFLLARNTKSPVVVCADKVDAISYLISWREEMEKPLSYILLDDGYQNNHIVVKKNILLLDARAPFGNGYLLPAGPLREKDILRADFVLFTHSDEKNFEQCDEIIRYLCKQKGGSFCHEQVFFTQHAWCGLWSYEEKKVALKSIQNKRFAVVSGVGSFESVLSSLRKNGVIFEKTYEFENHHTYNADDVAAIMRMAGALHGIIVTEKDWVKLKPLLSEREAEKFYVSRIAFQFLDKEREQFFLSQLKQSISLEQGDA